MPKGRIGLSLDEDVMGILNRYGRAERPGADATAEQIQAYVADKRPTRTEIIEDAVRLWVGEIGQYAEGDKRPRTNGSTPDRSTIPPDDRATKPEGALPMGVRSLERKRVVSIPKPGKK